ncbi:MAG TPA: hypothetical protein VM284_03630 [Candidatus Limnocylindria bacterium]|nr:hypothetical protein [Candidatus Limnocylindria bacterium]
MSSFWRHLFNLQYRLLAWFDPAIRAVWRRGGIGNILELRVARRDGKGERRRLLGLLHAAEGLYLGHPNGDTGWTRDLEAAGGGILRYPNGVDWPFRARRLVRGDERERAIRATGQHPFPGNFTYWLGRGHVRATGVFFRLESAA